MSCIVSLRCFLYYISSYGEGLIHEVPYALWIQDMSWKVFSFSAEVTKAKGC